MQKLDRLGFQVWAQDEARFGLKSWHKRRWMAPGYRPDWVVQDCYEWLYVYGAIEPLSGRSVFWLLPALDKESVKFFVEQFRKEISGEVAVVWDSASAQRSMSKEMPEGMTSVLLPAYSPELNPAESLWKGLRKKLANRIFETLQELESALCEALQLFWQQPEVVVSLTAYSCWRETLEK